MKTTFNERFAEYFAEQDSATQMAIYNEYAYATGHEPIMYMEEFDEVCRVQHFTKNLCQLGHCAPSLTGILQDYRTRI